MENIYSVITDQYTPIDQIEETYYNNLGHINSSTALINDNIGVYSTVNNKEQETHLQFDTTTTTSPNIPDCTTTSTGEIYSTVVKKDGEKVTVHVQPPSLSIHPQCDTTRSSPSVSDCTTTTTDEIYSTVVKKDGEKVTVHVQSPPLSKESTSDEMTPTSTEGDTIQQEPIYDQPIKKQPPQKPQRPDIF